MTLNNKLANAQFEKHWSRVINNVYYKGDMFAILHYITHMVGYRCLKYKLLKLNILY